MKVSTSPTTANKATSTSEFWTPSKNGLPQGGPFFCVAFSLVRDSHRDVRRYVTPLLIILLLISGLWTAWQWLRPYELGNNSPWQVQQVTVRRDHDYAWVEIELTLRSNETIPMAPLSRLIDSMGSRREPADTKLSSDGKTCQVRYWLEWPELESAWNLQMITDTLRIKNSRAITLEQGETRTFRQPNW